MSKNVAVFVDVANIFYAAKAAGVDIDYVTLLKASTAGRDFVRAYAYTGLDPENENQRQFHAFLARNSYKVVSKDIRKYGDGKVKANLDIELVVDMMKTARNLDIAVIVSGDGDFAPAIRAVQEMGVRVEVISFRGNTSSDLIEAADQFIEITQVAKVDKASTRSGRRVASDEEDLSMTEVPDKETEGTGRTRRRRTTRAAEAPAAEAAAPAARTSRRRTATAATAATAVAGAASAALAAGSGLVALPGEKLSKAAAVAAEATAEPVVEEGAPAGAEQEIEGAPGEVAEGTSRRRRRRGGRGRGRRRGEHAEEGQPIEGEEELEPELLPEVIPAPAGRRPTPFGSVWDAQIGKPAAPAALGPIDELSEEELQEPEIPEYLLAERRQRGQRDQRGRGAGRGPRGAYQAAMERERYGRGGLTGTNRYPDTSGRTGRAPMPGADRPQRGPAPRDEGRPRSTEPWSEVPPEIEALLRAQAAGRVEKPRDERPAATPRTAPETGTATGSPAAGATGRGRGTRSRSRAVAAAETLGAVAESPAGSVESERAPAPPARRRARKPASAAGETAAETAPAPPVEAAPAGAKRPARRRTSSAAAATPVAGDAPVEAEHAAARKPSTTRRTRTPKASAEPSADAPAAEQPESAAAPKRRRRTSASSSGA